MGLEIERRFLVVGEKWRELAVSSENLRQGYLSTSDDALTVRVRLSGMNKAWITFKAPAQDFSSYEFEYSIPLNDAEILLSLCSHRIYKTRHLLSLREADWIVDCFHGENSPLVLAEAELMRCDQEIVVPSWCLREVTGEQQWSNAALAQMPIASWSKEIRSNYGL